MITQLLNDSNLNIKFYVHKNKAVDKFGDKEEVEKVEIVGRLIYKKKLVKNAKGEQILTSGYIYINSDIEIRVNDDLEFNNLFNEKCIQRVLNIETHRDLEENIYFLKVFF